MGRRRSSVLPRSGQASVTEGDWEPRRCRSRSADLRGREILAVVGMKHADRFVRRAPNTCPGVWPGAPLGRCAERSNVTALHHHEGDGEGYGRPRRVHRLGTCDRGISGAYGGWWPVRPGQALPGGEHHHMGIGRWPGRRYGSGHGQRPQGPDSHAYGHAGGRGTRGSRGSGWGWPLWVARRTSPAAVSRTCPTAALPACGPGPSRCWMLPTRPGSGTSTRPVPMAGRRNSWPAGWPSAAVRT